MSKSSRAKARRWCFFDWRTRSRRPRPWKVFRFTVRIGSRATRCGKRSGKGDRLMLKMANGETLPVSRSRRNALKEAGLL